MLSAKGLSAKGLSAKGLSAKGLSAKGLSAIRRPSVQGAITFGVLGAAVVFIFAQLQPSLIFTDNTPSGGDMGSHVWGPAFMRDHLLPNLRITGWSPDWYAGFPAYAFYFPLPALAIVALDVILPYGIAFKLVTIAGILGLPLAAWAFGKLSGMRFPGPVVLAVATVPFLFDRGFTIYGGNIPSTLAGEFSFSISLALSLLFLGVVARGLDTGRNRALAGILLALTGLSHLLPTVFALVGVLLLFLLRPGRARAKFTVTILGLGALLAAFWWVPFYFRLPYINNMGWEKITQYGKNLFPHNLRWLVALAAAGAAASIFYRRRSGLFFLGMAAVSGALFVLAPQARLWNARVLPFWYLMLYLLAGVAVSEAGLAVARFLRSADERRSRQVVLGTPLVATLATWLFVGLPLGVVPKFIPVPRSADSSYIPSWARWNYSGYEGKAAYPEYKAIMDTMADVGRTQGCGRAHWEYESGLDRFGTPMALMLLPYWTHGCIGSMEGLYFESSATVPYHFLSAGELSKAPSNPMRDLPYKPIDIKAGVAHLQLLGAKYYMAFSPEAKAQADVLTGPQAGLLRVVATTGNWKIYEVSGSELVEPLAFQPAVVTGVGKGERPWLDLSVDWYMDPSARQVLLAESGPPEWARVALREVANPAPTLSARPTVGSAVAVDTPAQRPLEANQVSNIKVGDDRISFDVERTGQPVLVKISYFPNWNASGAKGPWRVTPNLMVVVPTSTHVELNYAYTPVDLGAWLLTFVGVGMAICFWRRGAADFDAIEAGAATSPPAPPIGSEDAPAALPPSHSPDRPQPARQPVPARGQSG